MATTLPFARRPSFQSLLASVYKLGSVLPQWEMDPEVSEDGTPYVSVTLPGEAWATYGAHWDGSGWVVVHSETLEAVSRSPDVVLALQSALA